MVGLNGILKYADDEKNWEQLTETRMSAKHNVKGEVIGKCM